MGSDDVLRAFADLAASGGEQGRRLDASSGEQMAWLGTETPVRWNPTDGIVAEDPSVGVPIRTSRAVDRLVSLDALHREQDLARLGWVLFRGVVLDGAVRRVVRLPAVARRVRLSRGGRGRALASPTGPLELVPEVADHALAARLEEGVEVGGGAFDFMIGADPLTPALLDRLPRLQGWIRAVAGAAGLPLRAIRAAAPGDDPTSGVEPPPGVGEHESWVVAYVGTVAFLERDPIPVDPSGTLRTLATVPGISDSALAAVYGFTPAAPAADIPDVGSPLPLSPAQREIVARARTEPLVVVSGPPGSGKSHTVAALAVDAVAHGRSVLLATRSPHAADVLAGLLAR